MRAEDPVILNLGNDFAEMERLSRAVVAFGRSTGLDARQVKHLNLAVEELFENIVNYAFHPGTRHEIRVTLSREDEGVVLRIEDDGRPFDPTAASPPETACTLDELQMGGLGIHLCRNLVDVLRYRRADGKNVVTLVKKIGSPESGVTPGG